LGAVPETEAEQDIAIGAFADAEPEEEFDFASDSSDDDYRLPVPDLPPRPHDHEARGSSSAMDSALLAILEGMRANQRRAAKGSGCYQCSYTGQTGRASETVPGIPGLVDCDDGRSYGCLRDSASSNSDPRHVVSQAFYSSAAESVLATALAPCSESAILDATAPGFSGCYLVWL